MKTTFTIFAVEVKFSNNVDEVLAALKEAGLKITGRKGFIKNAITAIEQSERNWTTSTKGGFWTQPCTIHRNGDTLIVSPIVEPDWETGKIDYFFHVEEKAELETLVDAQPRMIRKELRKALAREVKEGNGSLQHSYCHSHGKPFFRLWKTAAGTVQITLYK